MTAKKKTIINARRKAKAAAGAVKRATGVITRAERQLSHAQMEAQIAALEEKIAMLEGEGQVQSSKFKTQSGEVANQKHFEQHYCAGGNSTLNSELNKVGPNPLPAPTLVILSVSSNSILVDWDKVTNANGYLIEVAKNDSLFTNPVTLNADATETSLNIDGLNANTTYFIRVMATGTGSHANSGFSNVQSIKTLANGTNGMDGGIVGDLQTWLEQEQTLFQNMSALVPQLENTVLDTPERRRLLGSGVRRYGFIEKVIEVSGDYPQFWTFFENEDALRERVSEIDVLRNLLVWFRYASRIVGDLLLIAGDDAFRIAGSYYATARDGARRKIPEAMQVFEMLRLFWRKRRRVMDEPTEHEMERDFHAMMRGTKDGQISVSNESDSVVKGKKVLIDNTFPKPRGGVKVVESAEVE